MSRNALTALALAVLASAATAPAERVRLALEVREGGPHAVRRAIELAALVLANGAEFAPLAEAEAAAGGASDDQFERRPRWTK